jgi:hypothetical protein
MHFQHDVAIGAQGGDAIAGLRSLSPQQTCKAVGALAKFSIGEASLTVDDRGALRKYFRGAIKEIRRV